MSNTNSVENRMEQIAALKKAMELQSSIRSLAAKASELRSSKFGAAPKPPQKPVCENVPDPTYPIPKSELKFGQYCKKHIPTWRKVLYAVAVLFIVLLGVVGIVVFLVPAIAVGLIIEYVLYSQLRQREEAAIKDSTAYKDQCAAIDRETTKKRAKVVAAYQNKVAVYEQEMHEYNTITLPQYEQQKKEWEEKCAADIADTDKLLAQTRQELSAHYAATEIVPEQCKSLSALEYIYNRMTTSDCTLADALASYDNQSATNL